MTHPRASYTQEESQRIATVIRSQIGIGTFMTLGAHNLGYMTTEAGNPAFVFTALIIPTGQQAPRKMIVSVEYQPSDLYGISVYYIDRHGERKTHFELDDVYAEDLNGILFKLDREG
jgi:hypothetical protein